MSLPLKVDYDGTVAQLKAREIRGHALTGNDIRFVKMHLSEDVDDSRYHVQR